MARVEALPEKDTRGEADAVEAREVVGLREELMLPLPERVSVVEEVVETEGRVERVTLREDSEVEVGVMAAEEVGTAGAVKVRTAVAVPERVARWVGEVRGESLMEGEEETDRDAREADDTGVGFEDCEAVSMGVGVAGIVAVRVPVAEARTERVRVSVERALRHCVLVLLREGLPLALAQPLTLGLPLPLPDVLGQMVLVLLRHSVGEVEGESCPVSEPTGELEKVEGREGVGELLCATLLEPVRLGVEVPLRVMLGLRV